MSRFTWTNVFMFICILLAVCAGFYLLGYKHGIRNGPIDVDKLIPVDTVELIEY